MLIYKCFKGSAPNYLSSLLLPRIFQSKVNTRKDDDVTWLNSHPFEKLGYKSKGFKFLAPVAWNRLEQDLRETPSIELFKVKLKSFYYNYWLNK